jgi:hypothetical protein
LKINHLATLYQRPIPTFEVASNFFLKKKIFTKLTTLIAVIESNAGSEKKLAFQGRATQTVF